MKKSKSNMLLHNIGISFLISFLIIFLSACNSTDTEKQIIQSRIIDIADSCAIALSTHYGAEKSDVDIQKYQQLLSKKTDAPEYLENLGWAYVNKAQTSFDPGFYKLAEQTVSCMNRQQPNTFAAMLLQGHIFHNLHQFKAAETLARELVKSRGYWFDYGLLGDVLMEQGELTAATLAYQEMMNQKPGPQAYNRAAYLRWLKGDVKGALELLHLSMSSTAGQNNSSTAWTLTRIADYEFQSGHLELSLNYLAAVLGKQPNYAPALLLQGRIKMAQDRSENAIVILSRALQLNPLPEYRWALIEALSSDIKNQQKRAEHVRQLFKSGAIEDRRTYVLYLATTGVDTDKAVSLAKQELLQRHDVFTLDSMAWALRSNNQLAEAEQYCKQALIEGTHSARLYYHAGVIAYENGLIQQATRLLGQAKAYEFSLLPSEKRHLNQFL